MDNNQNQSKSTLHTVLLIISIINIFFTSFVGEFAVLWLIFGAFSKSVFIYFGTLIVCALYIIGSFAFLLKMIKIKAKEKR